MIHLYAVAAAAPVGADLLGIDGAAVSAIEMDGLHAVVSRHPAPVVTSTDAALAHARVVAAVSEVVAVVPVRLGPSHEDEAGLRERLRGSTGLRRILARVGGQVEFAVRHAEPPGRPPAPGPSPGPPPSGRTYLERRRDDLEAEARALAAARRRLAAVADRLSDAATDQLAVEGRFGPEVCFLVPRSDAADFGRQARDLVGRGDLVVAGPWPAYSFASDPLVEVSHG